MSDPAALLAEAFHIITDEAGALAHELDAISFDAAVHGALAPLAAALREAKDERDAACVQLVEARAMAADTMRETLTRAESVYAALPAQVAEDHRAMPIGESGTGPLVCAHCALVEQQWVPVPCAVRVQCGVAEEEGTDANQ